MYVVCFELVEIMDALMILWDSHSKATIHRLYVKAPFVLV